MDPIFTEDRKGLKKNTIRQKLSKLSKFYEYCIEKQVDGGAGASESYKGFNPVRDHRSLWPKPSEVVDYLSVEEAQALLGAIDRHVVLIGKRDYALTLMYLRVGWALRDIHNLRWGDLADDGKAGAVPEEVWEAIEDYLQASGRLGEMKEEIQAMRLATLMRTEKGLGDGKTELGKAISIALDEVAEEWDLK